MPSKSLKTLFMEAVLFISLFSILGHLSVNFWERYVIQTELSKMKSSLYILKGTVRNIGVTYDHLHDELKNLAAIANNTHARERESFKHNRLSNPERKTATFLDSYMQSSFEHGDKDINVKPSIRNKSEQVSSLINVIPKSIRNATTLITPVTRNAGIQKCSHHSATTCRSRNSDIDKCVDLASPLEDKYIQYAPRSSRNKIVRINVATRTRNPPRSTGAGTEPECIDNPRTDRKSACVRKPGPSSFSRYHENCFPDLRVYHRY